MAKLALALVLAALLAVAFAQVELLNPVGRGFVIGDAQHAPCGQSVTHSVPANQVQWHKNAIEEIEILIHGAHGGGVLTDRFSCTLNGDPAENLSPVYPVRGAVTTSVPDRSDQIYRIYARAPPGRCGGISTWQLIYQARDGSNFYQCLDVYVITAENAATGLQVSLAFPILALISMIMYYL